MTDAMARQLPAPAGENNMWSRGETPLEKIEATKRDDANQDKLGSLWVLARSLCLIAPCAGCLQAK